MSTDSPSTATLPPINAAPSANPSTSAFQFPRAYHFPPFFTRQPTLQTHHAQLQKWSSLILSYCRSHRTFKLSLIDALDTDLFWNKRIGKRLAIADVKEIVEYMRKEDRAEWVGGKGTGSEGGNEVWVWWRTPEEWATAVYEWVDETAQKNTVLTLYELTQSEATLSQEFHGMDLDLLQKALSILVKRGKAQVFGQEDQRGVKFF